MSSSSSSSLEGRKIRRVASRRHATGPAVLSVENLSRIDWYSRLPVRNARVHYSSDPEEDQDSCDKPVSEEDGDQDYSGKVKATEDEKGLLGLQRSQAEDQDALLHGLEKHMAHGRHQHALEGSNEKVQLFLSFMSAQTAYPKPTAAHVHPNRDTQKTEKILRPVSVPRPRTLLTSYINMHPVGAPHSGSHSHNKGHGSTKGATLIPSNISRKPSNSLDFSGNTLEPSSPKITCLGRIKIKHKYCKETEKPVHVGAHRVWKHRDMSCIPDVSKLKDSSHGRNAHTEAAPTDNVASCCKTIRSESGKKNALKEGKSYLKFQKGKKNDSTSTTSATSAIKSSPAETATDLGRFHANQNIQEKNSKLWSTSTNDGYRSDLADFAPQVPPPNSLLLIRNRKTRGAYAALNDSLSNAITGVDLDGPFIHLHSTVQELEREAIHYDLSSSSLSKMGLGQFGAAAVEEMHPDKTEKAGLPEMEMKQMFTVITECKPSDRSKSTVCHHETSSATALPETRLWQRRFAMKPSDIKIAKPFASQIN